MNKSIIPRPNFIIALFSTGALFIVSALATIVITLEQPIAAQLNTAVYQIIELSDQKKVDKLAIDKVLYMHPDVDTTSIIWRSGDDATLFMLEETGMDFSLDGNSPFTDMITFRTAAVENPQLSDLSKALENINGVKEVFIQHSYFDSVRKTLRDWRNTLILVFIGFILMAFALLAGLFKLILYAERKKIKTMELVGASRWYVMRPYLGRFLTIGLLSIIVALIFAALCWYYYIKDWDTDWSLVIQQQTIIYVGVIWLVLLLGILIISVIMLRNFLNQSIEELA